MPQTLFRYIFQRWLSPIAGGVVFYGGLLLANELVHISEDVFNLGASFKWLFPLVLLAVPEVLMLVLPMAAVLGGLMGTQQLVQRSEFVAAQGLGIGSRILIKPFLLMSVFLVAIAGFNSHYLVPAVSHLQEVIRTQMLDEARSRFLRTGQPPRFPPGSQGQALWMAPNGEVHVMEVGSNGIQHMVAQSISYAVQRKDDGSQVLDLQLKKLDGSLYQIQGQGVVHLNQESQDLRFNFPGNSKLLAPTPLRYLPTATLFRKSTPAAQVELSHRFSLPFASMGLLLLGIALGLGHPRFHSGGSILKSLAVILVYYFLNTLFENRILQSDHKALYGSLLLPWAFLMAGFWLLKQKLKPHISNSLKLKILQKFNLATPLWFIQVRTRVSVLMEWIQTYLLPSGKAMKTAGILDRWARALWLRSWGGTIGSLLVLDLLIEYANLAGDLAKNHIGLWVFVKYWIFNTPSFLSTALPIAFLLGTLIALAQACQAQEWVALRAGGVSLMQWVWRARWAWLSVLGMTAALQIWISPIAFSRSDKLYKQILNRSIQSVSINNWLYLGSTGVLWYQQDAVRWGFPLKSPGEAPILLRWQSGATRSKGLSWGGSRLVEGPKADELFPSAALRESDHSDTTTTQDLIRWQRWAPDPNRATLLWSRLLTWLAGPCLVIAMLSWAFPSARSGRGQSLGIGLVAGLLFLGLQGVFLGAAKSGEIPAPLGVLAPLLLFAGFGLNRLHKLRT